MRSEVVVSIMMRMGRNCMWVLIYECVGIYLNGEKIG